MNRLLKFSSYTIVWSKVRRWAFILGSTVPDPLKNGNLKGIADMVWTLRAKILTFKDEIWTFNVSKKTFS